MKITSVQVEYGLTQSLPGYDNIRVHATMTAEVARTERPTLVLNSLTRLCRAHVEGRIDDERERRGLVASYSTEPRYSLFFERELDWLGLFPAEVTTAQLPGNWRTPVLSGDFDRGELVKMLGHRFSKARDLARVLAERYGYELFDFSETICEPADILWYYLEEHKIWARAILRLEEGQRVAVYVFYGEASAFRDGLECLAGITLYPTLDQLRQDRNVVDADERARLHRVSNPVHLRELVELFSAEFENALAVAEPQIADEGETF
jgi:hypothetical protein